MKILVTGSSSGIGRSITEKLLTNNHQVLGLARDHRKFQPNNNDYLSYGIDFLEINTLEKQMKTIAGDHADISVIICCAGVGHFCELEQYSLAKMQELIQVNFLSQALLIKTLLPNLKKQQQGKIIFMGSEAALQGAKKGSIYCASKFALRGFAQSLRAECSQRNIAVTMLNPGMVASPFYDNLNFMPGENTENAISPKQIAETIHLLLQMENNCVVEEINLQPLKKVIARREQ